MWINLLRRELYKWKDADAIHNFHVNISFFILYFFDSALLFFCFFHWEFIAQLMGFSSFPSSTTSRWLLYCERWMFINLHYLVDSIRVDDTSILFCLIMGFECNWLFEREFLVMDWMGSGFILIGELELNGDNEKYVWQRKSSRTIAFT